MPSVTAQHLSERLLALIRKALSRRAGWLSFCDYMQQALYCPGLGYYTGQAAQFGAAGDFVTAPELSPLFGACVAQTVMPVLQTVPGSDLLELGPGSGRLAVQLLSELERYACLPNYYYFLDSSPPLREKQRQTVSEHLAHLHDRVIWLDRLPTEFRGVIVANEVLDALPCHLVYRASDGIYFERGVAWHDGLVWQDRALENGPLYTAASAIPWPRDYLSEIHFQAQALVAGMARTLQQGLLLVIDYGFPQSEYYHPQRHSGTIMGHYRHHSVSDPLLWPGLVDLSCHIDFSAVYQVALWAGLALEGFVSQAQYLMDTGLLTHLHVEPESSRDAIERLAGAQTLINPAEMGELFKVIAFSKGITLPGLLPGFRASDQSHRL